MKLRRIATIVVVLCIVNFGLLFYPAWRIVDLLMGERTPGTLASIAIALLPFGLWLLHEWRSLRLTRWAAIAGLAWLAVAFQMFLPVLARDLLALVLPIPSVPSGLFLLGAASALLVVGSINAKQLTVNTIPLELPGLAGKSLVQISDVHLGSRSAEFLHRVVRRVRDLDPDYVAITGDLVDGRRVDLSALDAFRSIDAPIYYVIGNHERYVDTAPIVAALRERGIRVLRGESVIDGPVQFIGLDDAERSDTVERGLRANPPSPDHASILLYHRPAGLEAAAKAGVRLMLSGHTHQGQIVPFNFLVGRAFTRWRGLHRLDGTTLYVSPGTGTWGPVLRLGSRNEITRFVFEG